jgi:hypothetical protein
LGLLLSTRETVAVETPAVRATSEMVLTAGEPSPLDSPAKFCLTEPS